MIPIKLSLISVSNVNVCVQPHFLEKVVMHTTTMDCFQRVETYHCGILVIE